MVKPPTSGVFKKLHPGVMWVSLFLRIVGCQSKRQGDGAGIGKTVWWKQVFRRLSQCFISVWREIYRIRTVAGTSPNLHLTAWSYHNSWEHETKLLYGQQRAGLQGICVKGLTRDRSHIQTWGHLPVKTRPEPRDCIQARGIPLRKGVLYFAQSSEICPDMVYWQKPLVCPGCPDPK